MSYSNLRNTQMGSSGLARYCSAPSSYLASLFSPPKDLDTIFESDDLAQLFTPTPPCPPPPPRRKEPPVMNSGWGNDIQSNNGTSGLIRQSSSPAGLFADINIENELLHFRGIGTGDSRFPWDDSNSNSNSLILSDDFLNGFLDDDNQGCESMEKPPVLSYRLSLPNQSFEKLLQDSVPCKIRARRGCATHPRSIAERVRRTKISERMKKLQELVPNMDKQTSTCDLLEFAVDYIKDLQSQVKALCEDRERCSCSAKYS